MVNFTFKDIEKNPLHYSHKLLYNEGESEEINYLLYNYGPYLTVHNHSFFSNKLDGITNSYLVLMVAFAAFNEICNTKDPKPIKEYEKKIIKIIDNAYGSKFYNTIWHYGNAILNSISEYQKTNLLLESAMTAFTPIVQYRSQVLVKPEMTSLDKFNYTLNLDPDIKKVELDNKINNLLVNSIDQVIKYNNLCKDAENITSFLKLRELIFPNSNSDKINFDKAFYYFLTIYLRYRCPDESIRDQIENILSLNNTYNNLSKGKRIDVRKAITVSESLITISL